MSPRVSFDANAGVRLPPGSEVDQNLTGGIQGWASFTLYTQKKTT